MDFQTLISGLTGNILTGITDKIKKAKLKKNIEKTFNETFSKSEYTHILDALSFDKNFTETIFKISKGLTIDCNQLVTLSLKISETKKPNLSRTQITEALKTFARELFNIFTINNIELGKIPAGIQDFHDSMKNLSSMPDCFAEQLKEIIKNAGYLDLEAKLKESEIKYKELQESIEQRDKADNITEKIEESLNACNFGEAEKLLLQSFNKNLKYTEKAATDAFQLATLKQIQLEYEKAKEYYEKAVRLSPNNSLYLNNLGCILHQLGEYNKAIECFEKALEINLKAFGENCPNAATAYNNIGAALMEFGEYKKAMDYYNKALEINLKVFGENCPNIATTYNNIGGALRALGEYKKAIEYLEKAEKICMQFLGADHPYTKNVQRGIKIAKQYLNRK